MAIYSGFSHEKWWFSIVMLNYQRVIYFPTLWMNNLHDPPPFWMVPTIGFFRKLATSSAQDERLVNKLKKQVAMAWLFPSLSTTGFSNPSQIPSDCGLVCEILNLFTGPPPFFNVCWLKPMNTKVQTLVIYNMLDVRHFINHSDIGVT